MAVRPSRDPWRVAWRAAVADGTLAALLLVVAAALAVAAWLPQIPAGDAIAYARRMSALQARFGNATQTMQFLGLFGVTHSWGFRVLVALVAACAVLRTVELGDRLRSGEAAPCELEGAAASRWLSLDGLGHVFALLSHAGALLVMAGLVVSQVWGWQRAGVVMQGGARVALPGREAWVALSEGGQVAHSRGVRVLAEDWGPGALVRAVDSRGRYVPLQQNPDAEPSLELAVALIPDPDLATRDALVAIPTADLVVRLLPEDASGTPGTGGLLVQAYRSPSGELVAEGLVAGQAKLAVADVTLDIVSSPYVQVTVARNPGAWPMAAGTVVLLAGLLATIVWRTCRDRHHAADTGLHPRRPPSRPAADSGG